MSLIKSNGGGLGGSGSPGGALGSFYSYSLNQSLRFDDGSSHHLTFTPSSAGSQTTWTWSAWIKRNTLSTKQNIFNPTRGGDATNESQMDFTANDQFQIYDSGATRGNKVTTRRFKDPSAWYHFVVALDTTDGTAADRVKIYVNGERETAFSTNSNPGASVAWGWNAAHEHSLGSYNYGTDGSFFDGYMAEVHFIDGTALDPTSFGETKDGVWIAKAYSGSYGTNGWYLPFDDSSAIGDDESGNTNDWTANNLAAHDVVSDSPTLNYPTMNPLNWDKMTFSEGNLKLSTTTNNRGVHSTFVVPKSGKWYFEIEVDSYASNGGAWYGFCPNNNLGYDESTLTEGIYVNSYAGYVYVDNSVSTATGYTSKGANYSSSGDIYSLALDVDNEVFYVARNGTWFNSADPAAGTGGLDVSSAFTTKGDRDFFVTLTRGGSYNEVYIFNFGQDGTFAGGVTAGGNSDDNGHGDFKYSVPSSFLALNSDNLPDITIGPGQSEQATDHFETKLWSSDVVNPAAGDKQISLDFQPDWVWSKDRSAGESHYVVDSVRGDNDGSKLLMPDRTNGEGGDAVGGTTAKYDFTSTGFDIIDTNSASGEVYYNNGSASTPRSYVGWCWKAGGAPTADNSAGNGATPTAGSVKIDGSNLGSALAGSLAATRLSANTTAGFSIVTWTAPNDNGTVAHGLSSAPEMIIAKPLGSGTNWYVMHTPDGVVPATKVLNLDSTADDYNPGVNHFNDTYPTSTVFSYGGYLGDDLSNDDKVAYCFHSVEGYSKINYYVGNGNGTNGPFVFTGFSPSFVMGKAIGQTGRWWMYDSARSPRVNYAIGTGTYVAANSATANSSDVEAADSGVNAIQFLSNGFKVNTTNGEWNGNNLKYIYLAFAESPFKFANAR